MKRSVFTIAIFIVCLIIQSEKLYAQDDEATLLIKAIGKGEIEKVKEMLENGTDPNLDFHSSTPLMYAIWSGKPDIFKLLVEKGALVNKKLEKKDPLINMAASAGNNEICEYLLSKGQGIDTKDREGKTPLMNAIYSKYPETAEMLIDKGADVNAQEINGWTALMFAAMNGDIVSVENLIKAKADVNLKTNDGETPLKRAKLLERTKVIEALESAGAK